MTDPLNFTPRRFIDFWKAEDGKVFCGTVNGTYRLDEIASFIWERCDGRTPVHAIIAALVDATNMRGHEETVRNDVLRLLQSWCEERLIILNFNPLHAAGEYDEEKLYDLGPVTEDADILLIVPPSPNPSTSLNPTVQSTFPIGIAMLSAVLKEHGYRTAMANLWMRSINVRTVEQLLLTVRPRVLGVSAMTDNFPNGVTIARIARRLFPGIPVIFGGPHVTFTDEESLRTHDEIDVVVRNEGEFALLELMDYYCRGLGSLERIRGITYRRGSAVVRNEARPLIRNLDELPIPDRGELNLAQGPIGIQTSRGCPGRCIFCAASSMAGGQYRMRSAESVMDEILYLYRQGVRRLFFQDDTFTADVDRLHKILEMMDRFDLQIEWSAESRVDVIDKDPLIFDKMAAHGCTWLQFGVEAGSQDVLDHLQKNIQVDQIFRAIRAARAAGIKVACTMLMGHPFDTPESITHSVAFAKQLVEQGAFTLFSIVVPYPGTQLARRPKEFGLTIHPTHYSDYFVSNAFMDTAHLTRSEIRSHYFDAMRELMQLNAANEGRKQSTDKEVLAWTSSAILSRATASW